MLIFYHIFYYKHGKEFFSDLKAKGHNMTNQEIWDIVKSIKADAIQRNLFVCENDVMNVVYFPKLRKKLEKKLDLEENPF